MSIGTGIGIGLGSRGGASGMTQEVKQYINGLTLSLSDDNINSLNLFVKELHDGYGVSHLSDVFDSLILTYGETEESALRNLVKNDHHATKRNTPNFTQFKGFQGVLGDPIANSGVLLLNFVDSDGDNYKAYDNTLGGITTEESTADTDLMGTRSGSSYTLIRLRQANVRETRGYLNSTTQLTHGVTQPPTIPNIRTVGRYSETHITVSHTSVVSDEISTISNSAAIAYVEAMDGWTFYGLSHHGTSNVISNVFTGFIGLFFFSKYLDEGERVILFNAFRNHQERISFFFE